MSNMESRHPDDAAPPSQDREQFPLGDIGIDEFFKKQNTLRKLQAAWNKEDYHVSIRLMAHKEEQSSFEDMYHKRVVDGYNELAEAWPVAFDIRPYSRGRRMVSRALFSTQSFASDILPPIKHNFEKDFEQMAGFTDTEVGEFAVAADATMKSSHPDLHLLLGEFGDLLADRTCTSDEEYFLVKACVALPYILSSNSRLLELAQQE